MSKCTSSLKNYLTKILEGDLTATMEKSLLAKRGDFGQIARLIERINKNTLNNKEALDKIANGDLQVTKPESHDVIGKAIETIARKMSALSEKTGTLKAEITQGKTTLRADTSNFGGCYKEILQNLNTVIDSFSAPLEDINETLNSIKSSDFSHHAQKEYAGDFKEATDNADTAYLQFSLISDCLSKLAAGDISDLDKDQSLSQLSKNSNIVSAIFGIAQSLERLDIEAKNLSLNAANGVIIGNTCDTSGLKGKYKSIIEDFDNALEAVSNPIKELIDVLKDFSVNDYTHDMSDSYSGDFKNISDSMTIVSTRLRYLETIAIKVSKGDISELEALRKMGKKSENDKMVPAFTKMMESIYNLITQSEALASAAESGNFDYKIEISQFEGEFKVIIVSLEKMFQNIAAYISEEAEIFSSMSSGSLHVSMGKGYKGQLGKLSEDINLTAATLNGVTTEITEILSQISGGNLAVNTVRSYKGDYSQISEALNHILNSLNDVMGSISAASEQVASGSMQVSVGSQNLSQGAAEQASSVEQLTASISEIATQTKTNAVDAGKANTLAITVKKDAETGMAHMNEMLKAVEDLKVSSTSISKIIKTIDDIAFQTNILALNAAVEAARAGQAGKGFAVVAEEVRNLAARSAKASSETTALIEETINKVEFGNTITNKTAVALDSIVKGIDSMESLIGKIATASNEQAMGLSQIDKGIMQVSQVIQTNSATAEESAAASEELSGQAEMLKTKVAHFKIRGEMHQSTHLSNPQTEIELSKTRPSPVRIDLDGNQFGKY